MIKNQESENQESTQVDNEILDSSILDSQNKIPETLIGLLSRYSPSGQEAEAVRYLLARMAALGFTETYADPAGNAIGIMGSGPRQLVLLGHIDTVPGEIALRADDLGRLYGRGSVDAKGPLAVFVDAVSSVGPVDGWQLVVIGAVDEENNSRGAQEVMNNFSPNFGIIGEPSGWDRVTLGYKGFVRVEVEVKQPTAHGASDQATASELAVQLWNLIQEQNLLLNHGREKVFDQVRTRLKDIGSGQSGHQQWSRLAVEARLPPGFSPEDWIQWLGDLVGPTALTPSGYWVPAHRSGKNSPLVRAFLRSIRKSNGSPRFVLKSGTSDMNTVAQKWDCPLVAYGPGDSNLDHTPNEHIFLSEFRKSVEILQAAILDLTAV